MRKWVNRHTGKHVCACGCGGIIEIKPIHHRKGIPKFIKGHNFASDFNPRIEDPLELNSKSPIWEMLSDEEKDRRISNLKMFGSMENHPAWKGGKILGEDGYVRVRIPEHPFAVDGYVLEHRYVMECYLSENFPNCPYLIKVDGKLYLRPGTVVHHINEQKNDNNICNLFPFLNDAAHTFWHKSNLSSKEKISIIKVGGYRNSDLLKDDESDKT